jgi:hypothetical protein
MISSQHGQTPEDLDLDPTITDIIDHWRDRRAAAVAAAEEAAEGEADAEGDSDTGSDSGSDDGDGDGQGGKSESV